MKQKETQKIYAICINEPMRYFTKGKIYPIINIKHKPPLCDGHEITVIDDRNNLYTFYQDGLKRYFKIEIQ